MDNTLAQLLQELYSAHATIDQLRRRVTQLEAEQAQPTNVSTWPGPGSHDQEPA